MRTKPTCTFPKRPYRILRPNDKIRKGDKFNYRNPPPFSFTDRWERNTTSVGMKEQYFTHDGLLWIVIRPL